MKTQTEKPLSQTAYRKRYGGSPKRLTKPKKWHVGYSDGHWTISNGYKIFRSHSAEDASWLSGLLDTYETL